MKQAMLAQRVLRVASVIPLLHDEVLCSEAVHVTQLVWPHQTYTPALCGPVEVRVPRAYCCRDQRVWLQVRHDHDEESSGGKSVTYELWPMEQPLSSSQEICKRTARVAIPARHVLSAADLSAWAEVRLLGGKLRWKRRIPVKLHTAFGNVAWLKGCLRRERSDGWQLCATDDELHLFFWATASAGGAKHRILADLCLGDQTFPKVDMDVWLELQRPRLESLYLARGDKRYEGLALFDVLRHQHE